MSPASPREALQVGVWTLPVPLVDALAGFLEHTHLWWPSEFTADEGHIYTEASRVLEEGPRAEPLLLGTLSITREGSSHVFLAFTPTDPDQTGTAVLGLGFVSAAPESGPTTLAAHAAGSSPHPGFDGPSTAEDWQALVGCYASFMGAAPAGQDTVKH